MRRVMSKAIVIVIILWVCSLAVIGVIAALK